MMKLFKDGYYITEDGNIYSEFSKKNLKGVENSKQYLRVVIKGKKYFIHRLVAEYYVPNPDNKPQVNHKDGNKHNNHPSNLEWVSNYENRQHAISCGLHRPPRGVNTSSNKLSESDVRQIRNTYVKGSRTHGSTQLAKQFGVSKQTILEIIRGEKWKHLLD